MDSAREKISTSNEPICKEEKAEFLIAPIALIAISFFPIIYEYLKKRDKYFS
jgi:hypothetical protein